VIGSSGGPNPRQRTSNSPLNSKLGIHILKLSEIEVDQILSNHYIVRRQARAREVTTELACTLRDSRLFADYE
jgi:hypothetical protein